MRERAAPEPLHEGSTSTPLTSLRQPMPMNHGLPRAEGSQVGKEIDADLNLGSSAKGRLRKSATCASMLAAPVALAFALRRARRFGSLSKASTRPLPSRRAATGQHLREQK